MESINNAANSASKAIFGSSENTAQSEDTREPVSGQTGSGTTNDPYDQGNSRGATDSNYASSGPGTSGPGSAQRYAGEGDTATGPGVAQGQNVAGQIRPEHQTEGTGVTGLHSNDPKFSSEKPSSSNESSSVQPSVGADPASGQSLGQKQQGADRPGEEPSGGSASAIKDRKDATENVAAGAGAEKKGSTAGQAGGTPHKQEDKDKLGTGTQYVKTTGLAADGGDFDATKPGAGREADRILESKGVHRSEQGKPSDDAGPPGDSSGKPGMGDKIKDKLHLGKH